MEDSTTFDIDPELIAGFIDEAEEGLATLDNLFIKLEADPANLDIINAIFRPVHTIKGNSAFFGLMKVKELAHEMETLLDLAKKEKLVPNQSVINVLLAGVDRLKEMLARTRDGQNEIENEADFNELIEKIISSRETKEDTEVLWTELFGKFEQIKADFVELDSSYVKQLDVVIAIASQLKTNKLSSDRQPDRNLGQKQTAISESAQKARPTAEKTASSKQARKTMRITEDSIDNFLNYVGELIVVGEMYNYLQKIVSESDLSTELATNFRRVNETFDNLSDNLQKSIMEIRKIPARVILQKVPRMVRDIATTHGKEVNVELHGEDVEIDKRLIETLDAPITHMVRNAVDHGIEAPDDRQTSGKPRQGMLRVTVAETANDVTLTISDDGKGLDLEAIKAKAVGLGLTKPEQELTQDQIVDMIFTSGLSTAGKVTEVSGRGVGMDVVNRNIVAAKGKITVDTKAGQGTKFTILLPKTVSTQIIDGFLVRFGCNCYVIPMDKVREVFRPKPQDINSISGKAQCVLRHGELLPVIKLADVFADSSLSDEQDTVGIMVSAIARKKPVALYVDEVIGVQKVVLKDLDGLELNSELYSAAAVMGDGTVAMVLDIDRLNMPTVLV